MMAMLPQDIQRSLEEALDEKLCEYTSCYGCKVEPSCWSLKQVDELLSIVAPMIAICRHNFTATTCYPAFNKLVNDLQRLHPGTRAGYTLDQFGQCHQLCEELRQLLNPFMETSCNMKCKVYDPPNEMVHPLMLGASDPACTP